MKHFAIAIFCLCSVTAAQTPEVQVEDFGKTYDGFPVRLFTLQNGTGAMLKLMDRGATVVELRIPDKAGRSENIVLGFDTIEGYESADNQYFGCTIGRVAGRISNSEFRVDGQKNQLAANDGPHHLHGGKLYSLDKVVWDAEPYANEFGTGVAFKYHSPNLDEGYPGKVDFTVDYYLNRKTNRIVVTQRAKVYRATPISMTNHVYFNLNGAGSSTVLDHQLQVMGSKYLVTDDYLIPTGEIRSATGTPLNFTDMKAMRNKVDELNKTAIGGLDHSLVLDDVPADQMKEGRRVIGTLRAHDSGRVMRIQSSEPVVHLYSGNFLNGQIGRDGKTYAKQSAVCLMPQQYPNAVNQPSFPSNIVQPGKKYVTSTVLFFQLLGEHGKPKQAQ